MPKLIISYRRSDSDAMAGRIRDNLATYYGNESIFIDVDNISFGIDFREYIRKAFSDHDMTLAVVGQKWLGPRKGGLPASMKRLIRCGSKLKWRYSGICRW
jgi:TIR domain